MSRLRSGVVALFAAAACGVVTEPTGPRVIAAEMTVSSPLTRALVLSLDRPHSVTVEYWADDAPRLRVVSSQAQEHSVILARLRPSTTYRYEVVGTGTRGVFTTEPLPPDLARVTLTASGQLSVPLVMLHLSDPMGFRGYAAVDGAGDVVWYWRTQDFPFGMTRRENGNFVVLDKGRGLVEITPTGDVVRELLQDLAAREMHHDVVATPDNTVLVAAFDDRMVDGTRVRGDAIWEWVPESGLVTKRWTAWDHFSLTTDPPRRSLSSEWLHVNSLAIGPRRNVVVSAFLWNQVFSITSDWREIEWRLGGANATFPLSLAEPFSGQHTAREISPGRVVLFDNGVDRGGYSRAVEFEMEGTTARTLWEWKGQPPNYSSAVSSARRLANGGTLVGFGMSAGVAGSSGPIEVYDVGPDGTTRWHLLVRTTQVMFRAEPISGIASEELVP